jgi:elongation factor P
MLEAIEIKRKMYFEFEGAPYHCLDVEVSKPTARGGQTLVRLKMRNLLTSAVFDKTFKAGEKFSEPDLELIPATYLYGDSDGYHFMDQSNYETLTLNAVIVGDGRQLLADNVLVQIQTYNGKPISVQFPPIVEIAVASRDRLCDRDRVADPGLRRGRGARGWRRRAWRRCRRRFSRDLGRHRRRRWPGCAGRDSDREQD